MSWLALRQPPSEANVRSSTRTANSNRKDRCDFGDHRSLAAFLEVRRVGDVDERAGDIGFGSLY
jgi:hypothetical protein